MAKYSNRALTGLPPTLMFFKNKNGTMSAEAKRPTTAR